MIRRALLGLIVILAGAVSWLWISIPDVSSLADSPPKTTAFMEQRKESLRKEHQSDRIDYRWVPYARISPLLRQAVIVSEDSRFYLHQGIDTEELKKVVDESLEKRKLTRGGSTITQQLAKNLYLSPSKNPLRKIRELLITWQLERHLTKKRILELYLNVVELGERTYGAEAAARHYFGKAAAALTPSEAALLAGSLPNPRRMNPGSPNRALRQRQKIILSRMQRWGTEAERALLGQKTPPPVRTVTPPAIDSLPATAGEPAIDAPADATNTSGETPATDAGPPRPNGETPGYSPRM